MEYNYELMASTFLHTYRSLSALFLLFRLDFWVVFRPTISVIIGLEQEEKIRDNHGQGLEELELEEARCERGKRKRA